MKQERTRADVDQVTNNLEVTVLSGVQERSLLQLLTGVNEGTSFDQDLDAPVIASQGCNVQRSTLLLVLNARC